MKAKELMTSSPQIIDAQCTIDEARELMTNLQCLHLPVMDNGHLIGVVSDRDLRSIENTSSVSETRVEDVMTDEAYLVDPEADIRIVASEMLKEKISSVIVREKGQPSWGIITVTDYLRFVSNLPENFN